MADEDRELDETALLLQPLLAVVGHGLAYQLRDRALEAPGAAAERLVVFFRYRHRYRLHMTNDISGSTPSRRARARGIVIVPLRSNEVAVGKRLAPPQLHHLTGHYRQGRAEELYVLRMQAHGSDGDGRSHESCSPRATAKRS